MYYHIWSRILIFVMVLAATFIPNEGNSAKLAHAYTLSGLSWRATSQPIHLYFNDSVPRTWLPLLKAAADQWVAAKTQLSFVYAKSDNGSGIVVSTVPGPSLPCEAGKDPTAFNGCTGGWTYEDDPTKLFSVTIKLNQSRLTSTERIQTVFLHELGHAIGLDHVSWPPDSVMFCPFDLFCWGNPTLTDDDKQALRVLYGGSSDSLPPSQPVDRMTVISALYHSELCKAADPGGLEYFNNSSLSLDEIRRSIDSSPEGQRVAVIRHLYIELLDRDPFYSDCAGIRDWVDNGLPLETIRRRLMGSDEYKAKHPGAAPIERFVIVDSRLYPPGVDTGIDVAAGQGITIRASGRAQYGPEGIGCEGDPLTDPDGNRYLTVATCPPKTDPAAPLNTAPIGAALARIGDSAWFMVGSSYTTKLDVSGRLFLLYNDTYRGDNNGSYTAIVTVGATTVRSLTLADSIADFSDIQGGHNWYYGYYSASNPGTFQQMGRFGQPALGHCAQTNQFCWFIPGDIFRTHIWAWGQHPNGVNTGNMEYWPVRRWMSTVSGVVTISGYLAMAFGNCGDGITGHIIIDGVQVYARWIAPTDTKGVQYSLSSNVHIGSTIDFAVSPGPNDLCDSTSFDEVIVQSQR